MPKPEFNEVFGSLPHISRGFMADKNTEAVDLEFFIACTVVGITALLWLSNYSPAFLKVPSHH
jgi:hypothetical protein